MMSATLIHAMQGLGDNIYIRAFARYFPGAYITTSWPEIYDGLNLKCVKPVTRLRTQVTNIERTSYRWERVPFVVHRNIRVGYDVKSLAQGSILDSMQAAFGNVKPVFDLPDFGPSPAESSKPIAVVRPVTERKEWLNSSRNPDPKYIAAAATILRKRGYHVVSVADLSPGREWTLGPSPVADTTIHDGRLTVSQLLALVQNAAVVVGGVGWIVPACISARTSVYVVAGGNGANNAPAKITSEKYMDLSRVGWAIPDEYCLCSSMTHLCKKAIHDFEGRFNRWLDVQTASQK